MEGADASAHHTINPHPPTISIIVPVYNGGASFRACLASISAANPAPDELIVIADGETDGSGQRAEECGAQVFRLSPSRGPAEARNVGAQVAHGDILFFVDADVTIPTDALARVRNIFQHAPELTAVFGSYDDAPAAPNFLSQYKNLMHHYVHQTAQEDASTFWGACGAIHREVFLAVGGFDQRYRRPSIEDIELGYRLTQAGYKIRLCPTLQVKHWKHWGIRSLVTADFFYRALPWTELIIRNRQLPNDLNLRLSSRVSTVFVYGLVLTALVTWWWPGAVVLMGLLGLALCLLNFSLYRFFWRKRGLWFAVRTMPWHWLYYFYSGLAFALGTVRALWQKPPSPSNGLPALSRECTTRLREGELKV